MDPLGDVFYALVEQEEHGLMWAGHIRKADGYGILRGDYVHRIVWELERGHIPEGMEVDHDPRCPKHCVTVAHLTLRGKSEHARVGWERGELNGGWGTARQRIHPPRPVPFAWQTVLQCPICGLDFLPATAKTKYCSPQCNNRAKDQAKKGRQHAAASYDFGPQTCIVCGAEFRYENAWQASKGRKTCSRRCMYKIKNDERSQQIFEERGGGSMFAPRACPWCGGMFVPVNRTMAGRQKYCSQRCGEYARRKKLPS
jgi:hypothetical protein